MPLLVREEDWVPSGGITLEDAADRVVRSATNCIVVAGPGAGKTELLAQRCTYLLQTGICRSPQRILAISFKRDAARNLKERVASRCLPEQGGRLDSYTFDAFSKQLFDRFLNLAPQWAQPPRDYRIFFPNARMWADFLRTIEVPAELGGLNAAQAYNLDQIDGWGPLPSDVEAEDIDNLQAWLAVAWIKHNARAATPALSFKMIGRLAEAILSNNPQVVKALRLTYSHVFLDEFQDTTGFQYQLVNLAFGGSNAVLTAVGDTKQRIMTWAGALPEVFTHFTDDFEAQTERLLINHRSNQRIVEILNSLVHEIEPDAVDTLCARQNDPIPPDPDGFWLFQTNDQEAEFVANFIADEVDAEGEIRADDFVLLVRNNADVWEKQIRGFFEQRGLGLRNEARTLKGIQIQELLADELALLLIGIFRLAIGARGREVYQRVTGVLAELLGTDHTLERDTRVLDRTLRSILAAVTDAMQGPPGECDVRALIDVTIHEVGLKRLVRAYRQYESPEFRENVLASLAIFLDEQTTDLDNWEAILDAVEGRDQVRLMTIHKSKGLEFHTVIFLGLHENSFWGFKNDAAEETNAFFVALSRARERVYFTRAREGGSTRKIQTLISLLQGAGVPFIEHDYD